MSAPISITCPECEKKFKVKAEAQGKKVRCPECKEVITVPGVPQVKAAPVDEAIQVKAVPVVTAAPEAPGPETDDLDPYTMKEQKIWPRCPNCANEMETLDATICLSCGYNTLTRTWGQTVKTMGATPGQRFLHLLPGILVLLWMVSLIAALLTYALVVPDWVQGSWLFWLDHESLRMWTTFISLGILWGSGIFCYKRFIINPLPEEQKME